MTYQLNGAMSVSPDETTQISPAKITELQICELIGDYAFKGLSFEVVCYKQTWTDIKICFCKWSIATINMWNGFRARQSAEAGRTMDRGC